MWVCTEGHTVFHTVGPLLSPCLGCSSHTSFFPGCTSHCPSGVHAAVMPHFCASLARLQDPVTQPDTNLVLLWKYHADVVNTGSPFTLRKDCPGWLGWALSTQLKGLTCRTEVSLQKKKLPADCSLDARLGLWPARLPYGFQTGQRPQSCMLIPCDECTYITTCTHTHIRTCKRLHLPLVLSVGKSWQIHRPARTGADLFPS